MIRESLIIYFLLTDTYFFLLNEKVCYNIISLLH